MLLLEQGFELGDPSLGGTAGGEFAFGLALGGAAGGELAFGLALGGAAGGDLAFGLALGGTAGGELASGLVLGGAADCQTAPLRDLNSMGMMIPMPPTPRPDGTVTPWLMPSPSTSSLDRPGCSAKLSSCSGFAWNVPGNAFANFLFHSEKQQVDSRMLSKFSLVQFVIVPRNQLADLPLCAESAGLVPSVGMFIPCPADIGGPASTCVEGAGATGPLAARAGY